jgi:hypothetical protein
VRFDSKDLALAVVFAALYAALVIVQGQTAAATIQLRIADCLIPLCALFGWPAIAGVTAGALTSNMFTSLSMSNGVYDVAFGPLANLLAGITVYALRRRRLTACVLASVEIGLIVGSYVWLIFGSPSNIFNVGIPVDWPFWAASIVSITISSLIAIAIIGYALLSILSRRNTVLSLKSRGLKVILLKLEPLHESFQFCQSNDLVKIQAQRIKNLVKRRM